MTSSARNLNCNVFLCVCSSLCVLFTFSWDVVDQTNFPRSRQDHVTRFLYCYKIFVRFILSELSWWMSQRLCRCWISDFSEKGIATCIVRRLGSMPCVCFFNLLFLAYICIKDQCCLVVTGFWACVVNHGFWRMSFILWL